MVLAKAMAGPAHGPGMISAMPEFFTSHPNVRFEFKKGSAKGIYAYRNGALELVA